MYLCIPPRENNVHIGLLFDEHAEELSFSSIYLCQFRKFKKVFSITTFMMATSELRRSDRKLVMPRHFNN